MSESARLLRLRPVNLAFRASLAAMGFNPGPSESMVTLVAQGVAAVVVRTPFEDFTVRVQRGGARPDGEQLDLARWAATQFRAGLDMGDPEVARAAQMLLTRLDDESFGVGARLASLLEEELLAGRLVVKRQRFASLSENRTSFIPELPPLPPPRREASTRTFEVRFLDEVGQAISGVQAEFTADGAQTRTTNAAGIRPH